MNKLFKEKIKEWEHVPNDLDILPELVFSTNSIKFSLSYSRTYVFDCPYDKKLMTFVEQGLVDFGLELKYKIEEGSIRSKYDDPYFVFGNANDIYPKFIFYFRDLNEGSTCVRKVIATETVEKPIFEWACGEENQ